MLARETGCQKWDPCHDCPLVPTTPLFGTDGRDGPISAPEVTY